MDFAKIAPKFLKIYSIEMNLNLKYEVNLPRTLLLRCSHYPSLSDLYEFIFFVGSLFWLKTIIVEIVFPRKNM